MATEKKNNSGKKRNVSRAEMIGGNHPEKGKDAILAKGRQSYLNTVDKKLGTDHSGLNEAYVGKEKQFRAGEIGKEPAKKPNPMTQEVNRLKENPQSLKKQDTQIKEQSQNKPPVKGASATSNPMKQEVNRLKQSPQPAPKQAPVQSKQPSKNPTKGNR